jgi:hypothetical protein
MATIPNNKLRNIKSFDDFDKATLEVQNQISFTVQKLKLRQLSIRYMLSPANIIDSMMRKTSAYLVEIVGRWIGKN